MVLKDCTLLLQLRLDRRHKRAFLAQVSPRRVNLGRISLGLIYRCLELSQFNLIEGYQCLVSIALYFCGPCLHILVAYLSLEVPLFPCEAHIRQSNSTDGAHLCPSLNSHSLPCLGLAIWTVQFVIIEGSCYRVDRSTPCFTAPLYD